MNAPEIFWHVTIHARGAIEPPSVDFELDGWRGRRLAAREPDLTVPFAVTFEEVAAAFDRLPRMFIEPDGAWVWVSDTDSPPWRLDGMLYDRDQALAYMESKGHAPEHALDRLLVALGWPQTRLVFQLTRVGIWLDEAEFRRLWRASIAGKVLPEA